jgi:hypothetical protein
MLFPLKAREDALAYRPLPEERQLRVAMLPLSLRKKMQRELEKF